MSNCHDIKEDATVLLKQNKILLMGNPNVGKSVFFTELTGIHAVSSNYTGTTVSFMEGEVSVSGEDYTLIDVPGTYSLSPTSEAEAVATRFAKSGASAIICVLDATNLERNLRLALEIKQYNIPTVYALNLSDVAQRHGISINEKLLEKELGAAVVPTIAVKKQGLNELKEQLESLLKGKEAAEQLHCDKCQSCATKKEQSIDDIWQLAKEISRRVIKKDASDLSLLDKLGESMMKPFPGVPIALLVMVLLIGVVVGGGKALRATLLLPLVNGIIVPFFRMIFTSFIPEGVFLNLLVGEYGIFVISFEWIIALILPYVFLFYIGFSFLEDSGYLPRVSVLFDNIMRKIGVQGGSLLYTMMGFGCAVPAIIGSRTATTRKERIMISAAVCVAIPCISQTGALIALTTSDAARWWMLPALILLALFLFVVTSSFCGKFIKGEVDPLLLEVPNLLMPEPKAYGRKLLIRMKHFMMEAEVPMLAAVFIAALLKETGAIEVVAQYAEPLMVNWLGMPSEAIISLILGFIRREMSVAPLLALDLTPLQIFIGGAVSLMYLPCLSVFGILVKEFKLKVAALITLSTVAAALIIGGLINQVAQLFI